MILVIKFHWLGFLCPICCLVTLDLFLQSFNAADLGTRKEFVHVLFQKYSPFGDLVCIGADFSLSLSMPQTAPQIHLDKLLLLIPVMCNKLLMDLHLQFYRHIF